MATQTFHYKSIGVKHNEENEFFQFIVKQKFSNENNRSLQWCKFDGLSIICETIEPSIIDFVKLTLTDIIATKMGHKFQLIN